MWWKIANLFRFLTTKICSLQLFLVSLFHEKKRDQNIWLIRMYGISEFSLSLAIVFMVSRGVSHEMFSFPLKIHVRQDAIVAMHRVTCLPSYKCSSIFRNIARILRKVLFLFGRENERKRESE